MFPALRRRDFRLLWLGNLAPQLSKWMEGAALGWLTLQVTDQPFYLGLVAFTRGLPSIVFAMGFGVLIDRFDRRHILLINQVIGFCSGLGMTYALLRDRAGIVVLLLFAFIMGGVAGVQFLTQQAMLSDLSGKENAVNAVALHAIGNHGTRIVGPSLAGYLIKYLSFAAAFFAQAVAYLWSSICFLRMRVPSGDESHSQQADTRQSLRAGWSYLRSTPEMAAVMGLAATFFLAGLPYTDLMPYFAREQLGADAAQYGQLLALAGVGAFAASLLLGLLPTIRHKGRVLVSTCAGYGVFIVFLAAASDFWTAALALILMGATSALYFAMNQTFIQTEISSDMRGRVLGVYQSTTGAQPIGSLILATLAQWFGTAPVFVLSGLTCLSMAVIVAFIVPSLWRPRSEVCCTG